MVSAHATREFSDFAPILQKKSASSPLNAYFANRSACMKPRSATRISESAIGKSEAFKAVSKRLRKPEPKRKPYAAPLAAMNWFLRVLAGTRWSALMNYCLRWALAYDYLTENYFD